MPWVYTYYTVPTSGDVDTDDMRAKIQQSIDNGISSGSVPSDFRGMGAFFGVSTSGSFSASDFRGKKLAITRTYVPDDPIQ